MEISTHSSCKISIKLIEVPHLPTDVHFLHLHECLRRNFYTARTYNRIEEKLTLDILAPSKFFEGPIFIRLGLVRGPVILY